MRNEEGTPVCSACDGRNHRLWTEPGKPKDVPDTITIGDQELEMNPPFEIHLECMNCKALTVYPGCYVIDRKTEYEDNVNVVIEEVDLAAENAAEAARRAMRRMKEEGEI